MLDGERKQRSVSNLSSSERFWSIGPDSVQHIFCQRFITGGSGPGSHFLSDLKPEGTLGLGEESTFSIQPVMSD